MPLNPKALRHLCKTFRSASTSPWKSELSNGRGGTVPARTSRSSCDSPIDRAFEPALTAPELNHQGTEHDDRQPRPGGRWYVFAEDKAAGGDANHGEHCDVDAQEF